MAATLRPGDGSPVSLEELESALEDEGVSSRRSWDNGPGFRYGWHSHGYHKVLYCVSGSIVFHTRDGDHSLGPGDRLEIGPGTDHAATVGAEGVRCIEGSR